MDEADPPIPDGLVTVAGASSPFEAQVIVARLVDMGIEAVAFDTATAGFGTTFRAGAREIPIQVRASDADAARAELARAPDPAPVDADADAPAEAPSMPFAARAAFLITALVVLLGVVGAIITIIF